ncbi:MAG: Crp/Fnr family transcriptional regulator [Treponemataceae bacterium]|nr:Crp/Fnr family transcriptional regulator [Treponemataceae bacterium]
MPRAMQYKKGSIIYFEGDSDERIYILQKGAVFLKKVDIETGITTNEQVQVGEFFGVKSALGKFKRDETASVAVDSQCVVLSVAEFEQLFGSNKAVILKMLRVFSRQLRDIHKKIDSILHSKSEFDQPTGMQLVAQSFFNEQEYKSCCDVCAKFFARFPQASNVNQMKQLYLNSKKMADAIAAKHKNDIITSASGSASGALKQFSLPAFNRFAKTFEPGSVIISEFEPGDCFYLIQSGTVQLVKCVNGQKKNLDILQPGEFFGEMAILENTPRSATCVAEDRVEVLEFNKQNFEILIMGNPQLAIILIKLFCKRIYDQNRRLKTLVIKDAQARIGDVFLMIDEMNPPTNPNDVSRKLPLTINDISHWSGLPIEDVKEEVNRFIEKRKIEVFENYIVIKNIVDLQRYVDQRKEVRI